MSGPLLSTIAVAYMYCSCECSIHFLRLVVYSTAGRGRGSKCTHTHEQGGKIVSSGVYGLGHMLTKLCFFGVAVRGIVFLLLLQPLFHFFPATIA